LKQRLDFDAFASESENIIDEAVNLFPKGDRRHSKDHLLKYQTSFTYLLLNVTF